MTQAFGLGPADAAIFETFVVPRYMAAFGEAALDMIDFTDAPARVAHLHCRTGYPDRDLATKLRSGLELHGCDRSVAAIELARAKGATMPDLYTDYRVQEGYPTTLPEGAFTHALTLHPSLAKDGRRALLEEFRRVLVPGGQAVMAMPIRGSFSELSDLLREYALKHEASEIDAAVTYASHLRPTMEMLDEELVEAGFTDVDVDLRPLLIKFRSGRDFIEDPSTRLLVIPDYCAELPIAMMNKPLFYVREAIDKYWSDAAFELTLQIGSVSAISP
ncbi:MAG: Biotin synthesis protein BioC [Myxococcaceae bacterium]|nr:Biotin synthesis protein BioC [Myxococcaceae bacterium]